MVTWFQRKVEEWRKRLKDVEDKERPPGLDCYCHKQMVLWGSLADQAHTKFSAVLGRHLFW
jgi:5-methylcytosine-specific restriction endonuclease McrA